MVKEYKGYNGSIVLGDSSVTIKRGLRGFLLGGGFLRGDKTIPYSSIVATQLKKAGLTSGYLQLTLKGGSEAKAGLFQSVNDENTINFYNNKNKAFEEAKVTIDKHISATVNNNPNSKYDELDKIVALKERGVLSEDEFEAEKAKILNK